MGVLLQDLRFAMRTLAKTPAFATIAILTLALGIGANTAIFSVVKAVLLNSLPYHQPDRLVTLAEADASTLHPTNVSFGAREDWTARSQSFESIALYRDFSPTDTGGDAPEVLRGLRVSHDFFPTLGVQPILGHGFLPEQDRPDSWHVLLLSHSFWIRRFAANPSIVGQTLMLDQTPYQIVGVLPESFQSLSFGEAAKPRDVWAPLGYDASLPYACRTCQHLHALARLKDGVSIGQARSEMNSVAAQLAHEFPRDYAADSRVVVQPLQQTWVGNVQSALWLLLGATAFVLLIACANIANLFLTKAAGKRREVALRAALGASRMRIARQLLTESILISLCGGAGGILLAAWGTSLLVSLAPAAIPRLNDVHFDTPILLFTLAISAATGILMGLVPALQASRVDHREALQQGTRGMAGLARSRFRGLLVISEVGLAFVLTFASGLLLRSFWSAMNVDPGFDSQNLFTLDFSLSGANYNDNADVALMEKQTLDGVRALPGVQSASIVSTLPIMGAMGQRNRMGFVIQDRRTPDPDVPTVDAYFVSPDYIRTMGISLLRGRSFTDADAQNPAPVALISQATARQMWPGEDPLGKRIQLGGRDDTEPWFTVVGVVGDIHQYGLDAPVTPQAYALYTHESFSDATLVIRSSENSGYLFRAVRDVIRGLDKDVPVSNPATMSEYLSQSLAQRRFTMELLGGFGALALLLAGIGIYGVMAYGVTQRTSEIGIRMALGAQQTGILQLVAREGMLLASTGLLAGALASLALSRILASQLFGVTATDPITFTGVALLLAAVAFLACYVPARRASRVDPMVALRYE